MKAEIITIGDEILIGQIVDTNSAWMGKQLNRIGWEISRIHTIPDTIEAIVDTLQQASSRSAAVLITGGLGPTKDDVTKDALCRFFECDLEFDQTSYDRIAERFKALNKPMKNAHRHQAMLPSKCTAIDNEYGTAPGMHFVHQSCDIISMPGVPYEMKGLMTNVVLDVLKSRSQESVYYQTLVTANVPESVLAERLTNFELKLPTHLKLAYLPHYNLVRLRLTAKGSQAEGLEALVGNLIDEMKQILGNVVIADEDLPIAQIVGNLLKQRNETVSFAESCTGGYVAHLITSNAGSSAYFPGSVVTYSYDNKTEVLGVDSEILWQDGAVSEAVVTKMARTIRIKNKTNYALALSGIAGPDGGTEEKPVGTVWMAVCNAERVVTKCYQLKGNRIQNIERSAHLGLELLRKLIVGLI